LEHFKILKAIRDDNDNVNVSHPTCIAICVSDNVSHISLPWLTF